MESFQFLLYTASMPDEFFGSGKDWEVRTHPEKLDHLVKNAYDQDSYFTEKMRLRFYLGKILHILFPHNIPNVHAVGTHTLEVQKIKLDAESDAIRMLYQDRSIVKLTEADLNFYRRIKLHPQFERFQKALKAIGIQMEVAPENFGFDENNNLYYLDSDIYDLDELPIPMDQLVPNLSRCISAIPSVSVRQRATAYLERLAAIHSEFMRKLLSK